MLVARVHKQVPCGSLASVRRTGRGAGPSAGVRATAVLRGNLGERCVEGHEQGEPEAEASTDGPSEGPAEGHAPSRGRSLLPWALESRTRSGLGNVLSAVLSGVEEFRFSGKAVLHVCRWQEEGLRDDRDSHSQGPVWHCLGVGGRCRQAEWASWSCDHCHLTTADVCPPPFFLVKEKEMKELCPSFM